MNVLKAVQVAPGCFDRRYEALMQRVGRGGGRGGLPPPTHTLAAYLHCGVKCSGERKKTAEEKVGRPVLNAEMLRLGSTTEGHNRFSQSVGFEYVHEKWQQHKKVSFFM